MLEQDDLAEQSDPLFVPRVMETHTPLTDDPTQEEDLLQRYQERVERLSQQDRVIKFCTDAGFLTTVEVGQYFMTKDTEEFSHFTDSVTCREYTLPKDENSSEPKGWIRENTKIGFVLELTTCYLQSKYGVEIRMESLNKDHSHSLIRISHDLHMLVTDLSNKEHDDNEQETSEMQFEDCALKSNVLTFASRSKANKAKPQRRIFVSSSTKIVPIGERSWTDIEPQDYSPSTNQCWSNWSLFFVMVIYLVKTMERLNSGDWKIIFGTTLCNLNIGLMKDGRAQCQKAGGNKKRFQYCTDPSGEILYFRALQGHSGRNLIDPSLQDNVLIPDDFFEYNLSHLSKRHTVFFQRVWRSIKIRCIGSASDSLKRKD